MGFLNLSAFLTIFLALSAFLRGLVGMLEVLGDSVECTTIDQTQTQIK